MMGAIQKFGTQFTEVFKQYTLPPASMKGAAESKSPVLCVMAKKYSRDAALLWLRYHIAETFAFLGIFDTISKYQIMQTASLILDHELYCNLNLDEFLLFISRFKVGDYGKIYQSSRPNPQEFLTALKLFWKDLIEERTRAYEKEERERLERVNKSHNPITWEQYLAKNGEPYRSSPIASPIDGKKQEIKNNPE